METEEIIEIVEEVITASFDVICRACLEKKDLLFPILDVHWGEIWLRDVLYRLFRPKERIEKSLPQSMCRTCIEELYVIHQFLEKYHGSTKILLEALDKDEKSDLELIKIASIEYQKKYDSSNKTAENYLKTISKEHKDFELTTEVQVDKEQCEEYIIGITDAETKQAGDEESNNDDNGKNETSFDNDSPEYIDKGQIIGEDENDEKIQIEIEDNAIPDEENSEENMKIIPYDDSRGDDNDADEGEAVDDPSFNDDDQDEKLESPSKKIRIGSTEVLAAEGPPVASLRKLQEVWYMCSTCDAPFDSYVKLEQHKNKAKHKEIQIFVCPFPNCNKRYKWHSRFVDHYRIHVEERPFQCAHCDKCFKTHDHASAHVREQHVNVASHVCSICKKTFKRKFHLDLHFKTHTGEKSVCSFCGKSFSGYSLYMHEQRHKIALGLMEPKPKDTGPKPEFQCHICSQQLSSKHCLEKHIQRHGPKNYKCTECPASYSSQDHLLGHINIKHTDGEHICSFCNKDLRQKYFLEQHQKVAHPGKKISLYKCNLCQKDFSNSISYNEHVKVHNGATNHYCQICDKYFASESKLNRHMRTHTGDKPFSCLICEKRFASKDYLKIHTQIHNKSKKFVFRRDSYQDSDPLSTVTEAKLERIEHFECDYCEKTFTEEDLLNDHFQEEHAEVTVVEMVE